MSSTDMQSKAFYLICIVGGEGREVFVAKWGEGEVKGTSLTKRN